MHLNHPSKLVDISLQSGTYLQDSPVMSYLASGLLEVAPAFDEAKL
jgi:hypothetical protein